MCPRSTSSVHPTAPASLILTAVPTRAPAVGCQAAYKTLTGKGPVNPLNHPWVEMRTSSDEGLLAVLRCPFSSKENLPYDWASGS